MRALRGTRTAAGLAVAGCLAASVVAAPAVHAATGCRVTYAVGSQWGGGFVADVQVTNLGDPVSSWTLTWSFGAGQQVVSAWNAAVTQSGAAVTARNVGYNGSLSTGASTSFGFQGSWTGSNPAPAAFALNGTTCTGSTTGTSTTTTTRSSTTTRTTTTATRTTTTTRSSSTGAARPYSTVPDGFAAGTTGGAGGATVTVTNQADLVRYATASEPYVIRVNGTIEIAPYGMEIRVASNKTIVGVGTRGQIVHGGFFLGTGVRNVIIRNLTIRDTRMADDDPGDDAYDYDGIQMDTADRIWIDHNLITRMNDGLIDSRKDTTNLTISWNVLAENNKTFGIGWTENVTARMTIHHNWFRSTNSRNPSTDNVAYAHLYNNYLQNVTGYGNYSRGQTRMVLENSYFENVKDPYYNDATAQLRQSGSICVGCTGKRQTNGSAFTPGSFYSYRLDPAADVPALLRTYAGPQADIGL